MKFGGVECGEIAVSDADEGDYVLYVTERGRYAGRVRSVQTSCEGRMFEIACGRRKTRKVGERSLVSAWRADGKEAPNGS